ncbi:MAG: DNA-formamidopyrimidine glycosylase family protein, partial [Candidatus Dormibacteraceae bacterium]
HAHLLRHPAEEFARSVPLRRVRSMWRRGKHLGWDLEDAGSHEVAHLVINPMLGGRLQLVPRDVKPPGTWIFALRLEGGEELRYFDFRAMGRIYFTADLAEVPGWAELGPEADTVPALGLDTFRKRLRRYRDEVKDLLRNQAFLAGIGNAYSDEIAWAAKLLPLRRRSSLRPADEEALFEAIPSVLEAAIEAIVANPDYDESKQDRTFMNVHGKGGGTCPRCGHRISQLGSKREPLNFCRGCQV